jgi:hypothetical protein
MGDKPDPTEYPEFQKVVRHFVTTPPETHKEAKAKKKKEKKPKAGRFYQGWLIGRANGFCRRRSPEEAIHGYVVAIRRRNSNRLML